MYCTTKHPTCNFFLLQLATGTSVLPFYYHCHYWQLSVLIISVSLREDYSTTRGGPPFVLRHFSLVTSSGNLPLRANPRPSVAHGFLPQHLSDHQHWLLQHSAIHDLVSTEHSSAVRPVQTRLPFVLGALEAPTTSISLGTVFSPACLENGFSELIRAHRSASFPIPLRCQTTHFRKPVLADFFYWAVARFPQVVVILFSLTASGWLSIP